MKDCTVGSQPLRQVMHRCVWSYWTVMQMRLGFTWAVHNCSHGHRSYSLTLSRVSTVHDAMQFMIRYAGAQRRMLSTVFSRVFVCAVLPESFLLIFTPFKCSSILSRYSRSSSISVAPINIITILGWYMPKEHVFNSIISIQSLLYLCVWDRDFTWFYCGTHFKTQVLSLTSPKLIYPSTLGRGALETSWWSQRLTCLLAARSLARKRNRVETNLLAIHVWYGGLLKWWYPQSIPKWWFLVGKPMVVGYHHFMKPLYVWFGFHSFWVFVYTSRLMFILVKWGRFTDWTYLRRGSFSDSPSPEVKSELGWNKGVNSAHLTKKCTSFEIQSILDFRSFLVCRKSISFIICSWIPFPLSYLYTTSMVFKKYISSFVFANVRWPLHGLPVRTMPTYAA